MIIYRRCRVCETFKPLEELVTRRPSRYRKDRFCKACQSKKRKRYYEENKDKELPRAIQYYHDNIDKVRKYYWNNVEVFAERGRVRREKAPNYWNEWRERNVEHVREAGRRYYHRRGGQGASRYRVLLWHIQGGCCGLCGSVILPIGSDSHVDHKRPVASYPIGTPKPVINCLHNLQLLCPTCNMRKKDRLLYTGGASDSVLNT